MDDRKKRNRRGKDSFHKKDDRSRKTFIKCQEKDSKTVKPNSWKQDKGVENYSDKRKLSIAEQIDLMKAQGIRFNIVDEKKAMDYLAKHTYYFRLKFYGENYDKYCDGSHRGNYINLEFAYLKEISLLDLYLRRILFPIVTDVEHYVKVNLLQHLEHNKQEDGYSIVSEFFSRNKRLAHEINHQTGTYAGGLVQKYRGHFALWNVIEVITFNQLIYLFELYREKYSDNKDRLINHLLAVKSLRNSIAHDNCLLNNLRPVDSTINPVNKDILKTISNIEGIGSSMRKSKASVPFLSDFVATIHAFNVLVTSREERQDRMEELRGFLNGRCCRHEDYFTTNQIVSSAFDFMRKVVEHYY